MPLDLIYTKTDKFILSKITTSYKVWQDKLYYYKTSLNFTNLEELVIFLKVDYKLSDKNKSEIFNYVNNSNQDFFELYVLDNNISIKQIHLQLLKSKDTLIHWEDWFYIFSKTSTNHYHLWIFLGGIANQVREIRLNAAQVSEWEDLGIPFIKTLATDLQLKESKVYKEAITENRRIL
ncbi:hypothetical protein IZU89_16885 [Cellulophaga lytica]|uniref:hypothetical protein n=1 Tax=Cellulophaga TaxID=104264 RepID=UPI0004F6C365|nr:MULTISPECIES: hypothetical protein [Cellulophaga]AIM62022.1 hypothetical protein IX49_16395 [Cellulophaga lytica]APU11903.1 hypothetical protein A5M85_16930 [Cellulophaga lytica]TVZ09652.1 hypothetical protein JM80_2180 [Cellulophaga sp. RHA_52]